MAPPQIFDVTAALKEHPEHEVATHLAQLHGVDRDAYLKEGLTDAEFLSEFGGKEVPGAVQQDTGPTKEEIQTQWNPVGGGIAGAGTGALISGAKGLHGLKQTGDAIKNMGAAIEALNQKVNLPPSAPVATVTPPPAAPLSAGQKWSAATGYGSGPGETVAEVVEQRAKENKPIGSGKITKNIRGSLGGAQAIDEINAREAENARLAQIRAEQRLAKEQENKAKQAFNLQQQFEKNRAEELAYQKAKQEAKFAKINVPAKFKPVAGGLIGYNVADVGRHYMAGEPVQAGISAVGAVGPALQFSEKVPPKYRALGTGAAIAAPVINRIIGTASNRLFPDQNAPVEGHAAGGAIQHYKNKGQVVAGALDTVAKKMFSPAHAIGEQKPVKMSDWAQNYIGHHIVPIQADRMGGVGGPSYSANQLLHDQYKDIAWGSGQPGTATMIANLAKDPRFGGVEKQIFTPSIGDVHMHKSNQIVHDLLADEFYKNQDKLTPELAEKINTYMQLGGPKKSGKLSFDPMEGFDIRDRDRVAELAKTFENRKLISQHAFGGEGIGKRKAQIIPYEDILHETSDPFTHGADTFSVGPRAFTLTGETNPVARPDLNVAYPYQLYGKDLGVTYQNTPSNVALLDFQNQWRKDTGKTLPNKSGSLPQPGYYEHTLGYTPEGSTERVYPRQEITEDWLKELQRSGFAKGGSTTPAWQRKEGKNPEGGLNAIGRASYNRETGGNLKAPQPEGGPRKKSFCARMEGMKKKNTSSETANDPDSRINKSLRKWKC